MKDRRQAQGIAVEAARIIAENGRLEISSARRKAAERLGCRDKSQWPTTQEIETAVRAHQRLFQANQQPEHLAKMRQTAVCVMRFFAAFRPRLFGAVLDGFADRNSTIRLLLETETTENVLIQLLEARLPHQLGETALFATKGRRLVLPCVQLKWDNNQTELILLNPRQTREIPRDPSSGAKLASANLTQLLALTELDALSA